MAREGILKVTKFHYEEQESNGVRFYKKAAFYQDAEGTEDESGSGVIMFQDDEKTGLNPGRYIELYLTTLHPEYDRFFQKPQRPSKAFDIHDLTRNVLFENLPLGKNKISLMLKTLCGIVDKPPLTNHSLRTTGIRLLKACESLQISQALHSATAQESVLDQDINFIEVKPGVFRQGE